jgi:hypothetical protein
MMRAGIRRKNGHTFSSLNGNGSLSGLVLPSTRRITLFWMASMDRVAAEVAQEIGVFFEHEDVHARPRQQETQHHSGAAASGDAAARVNSLRHSIAAL